MSSNSQQTLDMPDCLLRHLTPTPPSAFHHNRQKKFVCQLAIFVAAAIFRDELKSLDCFHFIKLPNVYIHTR